MTSPDTRLQWMAMLQQTQSAAQVCAAFGISRPTLKKWSDRYQRLGPPGLDEPSRAPATSPNRKIFPEQAALILALRREQGLGLHRLRAALRDDHGLDVSADTVLKVLRRAGEPNLRGQKPPPQPATPPDPASATIADLITSGALRPGEKLSESALAARLGLGRTLVREALKQLAVHGLVTLQHHRGAFVARPSLDEVEQAYAARRLIEGAIVADVACHCTAHDIRSLRRHLDQQRQAHDAGQKGRLVHLLTEFHLVIAALGGNRVLEALLTGLTAKTSLAVMIYDRGGHPACALEEHAQIIDLLARGEAGEAARLMQRHLTTNEARLQERAAR